MDKAILITGLAEAGKTEIANFVIGYHPTAMIIPMAGKLKEIARRMGWDGKKDERGRRLLQHLGTEVGRVYDEDMWVNFVIAHWSRIKRAFDHDILVSDDVRYPNEHTRICEHFGAENTYVIRVERDASGLDGTTSNHISEQSYLDIPCDVLIVNNGSLSDLEAEVISFISTIF
jgi:hypothetical protein